MQTGVASEMLRAKTNCDSTQKELAYYIPSLGFATFLTNCDFVTNLNAPCSFLIAGILG